MNKKISSLEIFNSEKCPDIHLKVKLVPNNISGGVIMAVVDDKGEIITKLVELQKMGRIYMYDNIDDNLGLDLDKDGMLRINSYNQTLLK